MNRLTPTPSPKKGMSSVFARNTQPISNNGTLIDELGFTFIVKTGPQRIARFKYPSNHPSESIHWPSNNFLLNRNVLEGAPIARTSVISIMAETTTLCSLYLHWTMSLSTKVTRMGWLPILHFQFERKQKKCVFNGVMQFY